MAEAISLCLFFAVFLAIIKFKRDPRLAFVVGGLILKMLSQQWDKFLDIGMRDWSSFGIATLIVTLSFGFAEVLKAEKYSEETLNLFVRNLEDKGDKSKSLTIAIAMLATWIGSFSLLSANASCGLVAPIVFPILIRIGMPAEFAATAIIVGAWGTIIHPADINANMINSTLIEQLHLQGIQPPIAHMFPAILAIMTIVVSLRLSKSGKMWKIQSEAKSEILPTQHKISVRSIISFLPFSLVAIYLLISMIIPKSVFDSGLEFRTQTQWAIIASLFICSGFAIVIAKTSKPKLIAHLGRGGLKGIWEVMALIIASKIFISGFLAYIGDQTIATWIRELGMLQIPAAVIVTFAFAILTGSGDAIITSITQVVIPFLAPTSATLASSMVWFSGEIGRCASPVSAATRTVAKAASVEPSKVAWKAAVPVSLGLIAAVLCLLLIKYLGY